jgi:hypothetical protein
MKLKFFTLLIFILLYSVYFAGKGSSCTPPTKPNLSNTNSNVCPISSNTYAVSNIVSGATYSWNFTGTGTLSDLTGTSTTLTNVTSSGKLAVQASNGSCSSFRGLYIHTFNVPTPNAGSSATICSGGSVNLGASGASTFINQVAFREDFGIPDLPGWTRNNVGGNAQWWHSLEYTPFNPNTTTANNGYMVVNSDAHSTSSLLSRYLITPSIDFSYYTSVNFAMSHFYDWYNGSEYARLEVSIDGGTTWSTVNTWMSDSPNPQNYSVSVPTAVGQSNVKFRYNYYSNDDWYWFIDDILITGDVPVSYSWFPTNGLSSSTIANPTASPSTTTTYTLTATAGNCSKSSSTTVTVVADPILDGATITNPSFCVGSIGSIDVSSSLSGGTGTQTPVWEFSADNSIWNSVTNGTPTVATYTNNSTSPMSISGITTSGTYYFRRNLSATSAGCNALSSAVTLTVNQPPSINAISPP